MSARYSKTWSRGMPMVSETVTGCTRRILRNGRPGRLEGRLDDVRPTVGLAGKALGDVLFAAGFAPHEHRRAGARHRRAERPEVPRAGHQLGGLGVQARAARLVQRVAER